MASRVRKSGSRAGAREIVDSPAPAAGGGSAQKKYETELWIREGDARVRVPVEMIERLEADGDYVKLHVGQRVRLMRARLGDLAERLDPAQFVRIHRSEIVRHDLIAAVRRHDSGRTFAVLAEVGKLPSAVGSTAHHPDTAIAERERARYMHALLDSAIHLRRMTIQRKYVQANAPH